MTLVRFRDKVRPVSRFNFLCVVRFCVCAFVPRKGFSLALFFRENWKMRYPRPRTFEIAVCEYLRVLTLYFWKCGIAKKVRISRVYRNLRIVYVNLGNKRAENIREWQIGATSTVATETAETRIRCRNTTVVAHQRNLN